MAHVLLTIQMMLKVMGEAHSRRDALTVHDQILDRYVQAIGGPQRLAKLTSFIAKGTYSGFDTSDDKVPVEVYAKAPDQRTTIYHVPVGGGVTKDGTMTYDGRSGWINAASTLVPMLTLTGGNLDGARVDAVLSFPGEIKLKHSLVGRRASLQQTSTVATSMSSRERAASPR